MPIYEFRCEACGKVSEFQMKLSDAYPTDCPLCTLPKLKKIMSLPSFQLKGSGWYSDSYDGKSNKKVESGTNAGDKSVAESASTATNKTETPSASPKTETAPAAAPKAESKA